MQFILLQPLIIINIIIRNKIIGKFKILHIITNRRPVVIFIVFERFKKVSSNYKQKVVSLLYLFFSLNYQLFFKLT